MAKNGLSLTHAEMYKYAARILRIDDEADKDYVILLYLKHSEITWERVRSEVSSYVSKCKWQWCKIQQLFIFK